MLSKIQTQDENLRLLILSRVMLGMFIIGLTQLVITIFGHKSSLLSLSIICLLIAFIGFAYRYVTKYRNPNLVGRVIIYFAVPALVYRAYTVGGAFGVTTNWIYLIPVFAALFLSVKEMIGLTVYMTVLMIALGFAHVQDPEYALTQLQLVPISARIFYLLMPLFVITYIVNFNERQRKGFLNNIEEQNKRKIQEEKLISIGTMSAAMAHEINNPLTILTGSVSILKRQIFKGDKVDLEKIEKHIKNLDSGIDRISKIVASVKSLSSDSQKLDIEKFKISDILENALVLFQGTITNNEINISFDNSSNIEAYGVKIQIEQILMIFIANSIDEISEKSEKNKRWISVNSELSYKSIVIRCVDSGAGISEENQDKIFDPFFTSKVVGKGTGLGLSIAKKMAKRHGGDIYYELYKGNTSFVLELPRFLNKLNTVQIE